MQQRFFQERGCSWQMVRKEILGMEKCQETLFSIKKKCRKRILKLYLMFNVTYYPVYRNLKTLLHILACDGEHRKVFPNVSMIGLKKSKNLRWHLVRVAPSTLDKVMPKLCGRKRPPCQLCSSMKDTNSFKSKHFKKVHHRIKSLD